MVADVLARILARKRQEVAAARQALPLAELRARLADLPPPRPFLPALRPQHPGDTRIIAEIKKASPSAGILRADFDPVALAQTCARHGAAALSVLTDGPFFQGDLRFLAAVRQQVALPLLRKDFLLDPYQLYEARYWGADAVLLIAAALPPTQLAELVALSQELGLEPLVEVHTPEELAQALATSCRLIGINNRDLHTFRTDVATTLALLPHIPPGYVVVSESGLHDRATLATLQARGVHAFLIGEALMRQADLGAKLDELRGVAP
ncbi:MAG: indole-3-glycerol-phosphate synthase [Candidatus Tectimicrobiota bacterium]|nr:MAG: indole-3-glycerol-phosphate synthase [Candidatus Tectomicrobia bacterium]